MHTQEGINALFLYATEAILVTSDKGDIVQANPSAEKLFGYAGGELIGKKVESLIPKRFNAHESHRNNFNKNPHNRAMGLGRNLFALTKTGAEIPVEISLSPYSNKDGRFVIAFIIDVTLQKQAEDKLKNYSAELEQQVKNRTLILEEAISELEKTKKDLNIALSKEKDLNEMKSRFVSMASHEFRTPLTTIMSSLSLVARYGEQGDKANQDKHIAKIKASIDNLTDILNDFLSVSKLEEGKIENHPEEIKLGEFITEIINETQLLTNDQELLYTHEGNMIVYADRKLLKNILLNLISNAVKFSHAGKNIYIHTAVTPSLFTLSVKDEGIGISKEDQKHLFERFFRGHNAMHIQGTGLGLNIVTKYTELMQGSIDFESTENQGTTFTVSIPQ